MPEPKRVVLVEPGDILLIGNVGTHDFSDSAETIRKWAEVCDLRIAVFAGAIEVDTLKADRA